MLPTLISPSSLWRRVTRRKMPSLSLEQVRTVVTRHGVHEWYVRAYGERAERSESWRPCYWIHDHLPPTARILETGCGIAATTAWLGQYGFRNLWAFDIDAKVVAAARDIIAAAGVRALLWEDDGLHPAYRPISTWDTILAINWLTYVEKLDLVQFVQEYADRLNPGGALIFDVIDASYSSNPLSRFLTSDWQKPVGERRPSEYKQRFSRADVERAAAGAGLIAGKLPGTSQLVPRKTYVLQKPAADEALPVNKAIRPNLSLARV
jgi:SAM-dependent methyltransferase